MFLASYTQCRKTRSVGGPTRSNRALKKAGNNRDELEQLLNKTPEDQPQGDGLPRRQYAGTRSEISSCDFLLENVELAYKARKQVAWGDKDS